MNEFKEFPLNYPEEKQIKYLANIAAKQNSAILYCNTLFALQLAALFMPIDTKNIADAESGYIGKYYGIPIYITLTFPNDKPHAVIVPQYIEEK